MRGGHGDDGNANLAHHFGRDEAGDHQGRNQSHDSGPKPGQDVPDGTNDGRIR